MRGSSILAVALAILVSTALPSLAGIGFELSESGGRPGERIDVEGSGMLTCCPTGTPTEASLVLWVDPERPSSEVALFEGVAADALGNFSTSFTVPPLPAGEYELRYCSLAPESLLAGGGQRVCVPGESFTIFEPVSYLWLALAAVLLVVILLLVLWSQRRRRRLEVETIGSSGASSDPSDPTDQIETLSGRPIGSSRR